MSNMTSPPTPVDLHGDMARTVCWTLYKKDLRAEAVSARSRAGIGAAEVVPVRTFRQRGWALMIDRPDDHRAVLLGVGGRGIAVDLRPATREPAPVREYQRDGQTWCMSPADLCLRHRSISTIDPSRRHEHGWWGPPHWGGDLVTQHWTELTLRATGPQPHQHETMIVRCSRTARLTGWHAVAEDRLQVAEYHESSGLVTPAYRANSGFAPGFDRWLARAALWAIRNEDPAKIPVIDVPPTAKDWDAYADARIALETGCAR